LLYFPVQPKWITYSEIYYKSYFFQNEFVSPVLGLNPQPQPVSYEVQMKSIIILSILIKAFLHIQGGGGSRWWPILPPSYVTEQYTYQKLS
jgi:hypothetical protein